MIIPLKRSYGFEDRLVMSEGVAKSHDVEMILLENIPGALNVKRASKQDDRNGTDYWVELISGKRLSVDLKARSQDYSRKNPPKDDLALETWSVIGQKIGWTRDFDKQTDYVLWLWQDTGRWCLIPFAMLCKVFSEKWQEWIKVFRTDDQDTEGRWKSQCVFVPRRLVWQEIYKHYAGAP